MWPVMCVIRRERLCELLHLQRLGTGQGELRWPRHSSQSPPPLSPWLASQDGRRSPLAKPVLPRPQRVQVDTFQMMTSAKQMPAKHFTDYSFVY